MWRPFLHYERNNMPDEETGAEAEAEVAPEPVDVSLFEAKIAELTVKVAELEATVAAKDAEITAAKAANYDLLTTTPIPDVEAGDEISPDATEEITPDDLFGKDDE